MSLTSQIEKQVTVCMIIITVRLFKTAHTKLEFPNPMVYVMFVATNKIAFFRNHSCVSGNIFKV